MRNNRCEKHRFLLEKEGKQNEKESTPLYAGSDINVIGGLSKA